jgi:hypothetical protein
VSIQSDAMYSVDACADDEIMNDAFEKGKTRSIQITSSELPAVQYCSPFIAYLTGEKAKQFIYLSI